MANNNLLVNPAMNAPSLFFNQIVSVKLTSTNYLLWKSQFRPMLRNQKLIGLVDGGHPQPSKMKTSCEVWKSLGSTLSQHSKAFEFQLKQALQECKKGNSTIDEHLRTFKNIYDSLGAIGCSVPDEDKFYWLLQGLRPNYESFAMAMPEKPLIPSYQEAMAIFKIHDLRASSLHKYPMESVYVTQRGGGYNLFDHALQSDEIPEALASRTIGDRQEPAWYPDSGTTSYMTNNEGNFYKRQPNCGTGKVIVGRNGLRAHIAIINSSCDNSNVFALETDGEDHSDYESDNCEEPNFEELYSQLVYQLEKLKNEKQSLSAQLRTCEHEKHTAMENVKLAETKILKLKLDLTSTQQKLEVFYHGARNIDKILSMSKNGTDKRELGFDEQHVKSTSSQVTKFVKANSVPYLPTPSVITTPHRQTKQFFVFHVFYCQACGRKGHLTLYCRYVPKFHNRNDLHLEREKPYRSYAQSFANSSFIQKFFNGFRKLTQATEEQKKSSKTPPSKISTPPSTVHTNPPRNRGIPGYLDDYECPTLHESARGYFTVIVFVKLLSLIGKELGDWRLVCFLAGVRLDFGMFITVTIDGEEFFVTRGRLYFILGISPFIPILRCVWPVTSYPWPAYSSEGEFIEDEIPILPYLNKMVIDITSQHNLYTGSGTVTRKMLDDETRLVHRIIISNILSRSQKNELSERMKVSLYAFKNDVEIDLPNIIIAEMIDASTKMTTRNSLAFARIVIDILLGVGYKVFPGEPKDTKVERLNASNFHRSASHLPSTLPSNPAPPGAQSATPGEVIGSSSSTP
ncbi:hypothetical protein GIB67_028520 [Kingdonia uniflora]|uniref:Retrotransposon Copia-like N-terminal domain-containing protein n=1 Tax=Kingdonia uniflora TaxID=39325 RepID=A0A7J7KVV0_9MAGN|nr:hypothetical protein GIB67_028520 [Kingdonia uniflora]